MLHNPIVPAVPNGQFASKNVWCKEVSFTANGDPLFKHLQLQIPLNNT
jgi:hypothetical protein